MKKKIIELTIQIIPVMIGVYLAFLVSDWSSKNQKRHQSNVLMESLLSEIGTNSKRIEKTVEYHKMLRDSSRFYSDPKSNIIESNFFKGTRILKLTNSAYNTGIQTGVINEFPIEKIRAINELYTLQNDYNEFRNLIMSSLINKDFSYQEEDMREIARFLSVTMTDIVIKEAELLEGYDQLENKLKN